MPTRRLGRRLALIGLLATPLSAQEAGAPMSAIDWLSDSVAAPLPLPATPAEPAVTPTRPTAPITVSPLDAAQGRPDAIGILSPAVTGLPADLWGASRAEDIARRIRAERAETLPALQALLYIMLLAEIAPPRDASADGRSVFLARVDKLLEMGALDQAGALLERAGLDDAEIFRRRFDVALLVGEEQPLCETMSDMPGLSPTFQARIFCLARAGDWTGAELLLGTGSVLGLIGEDQAELFARFLDTELFEGEPPLPRPVQPTPLTFRLYEAIGEPIPTNGLPLAFAHADLREDNGWKARIEAGERLARTGAVSDNQLLGLYTEREPAASGGVWTRVAAIQALQAALDDDDTEAAAEALARAWSALTATRVEVPIARVYGPRLHAMGLPGEAAQIAFRMALLSDGYESAARSGTPDTPLDRLLAGVAQGDVAGLAAPDARAAAVLDGFRATRAPARLASLVEGNRLGEAILRALALFDEGVDGNLDQVTDALALLRAVGLEDTARRAALEYLILDRRG
ncbi:hypothetical protein [Sinisalibacter lacisalsi]|uniref:Uncharacterized protein n=1 Tax=Sinisalibacter lacisalsi TaxID=1526570 RepID=A0ABQ1QN40_9RHOB|nr:hypothetical protein [Sinisalibacter lacisalsi]GGD32148.1 hypothetical protein GCM10011358_15290 [Sinisalibacter lacisalsi]